MSWAPITTKGVVVNAGDKIEDFKGIDWVFIRVSRPPIMPSTGKIIVQEPGNPGNEREFYPSVFALVLEEVP